MRTAHALENCVLSRPTGAPHAGSQPPSGQASPPAGQQAVPSPVSGPGALRSHAASVLPSPGPPVCRDPAPPLPRDAGCWLQIRNRVSAASEAPVLPRRCRLVLVDLGLEGLPQRRAGLAPGLLLSRAADTVLTLPVPQSGALGPALLPTWDPVPAGRRANHHITGPVCGLWGPVMPSPHPSRTAWVRASAPSAPTAWVRALEHSLASPGALCAHGDRGPLPVVCRVRPAVQAVWSVTATAVRGVARCSSSEPLWSPREGRGAAERSGVTAASEGTLGTSCCRAEARLQSPVWGLHGRHEGAAVRALLRPRPVPSN